MKQNIAVLGTGSDVGKSIIAAALCRVFHENKIKVAPFKAQNMSNNSGITPEGLEIGRAQIVQAEAAKIAPDVRMNPILLKPTGDKKSQVVLNGVVHGDHTAMDYHLNKNFYRQEALHAFDNLRSQYDRIIIEGAGSCAEVNLMANDIVNFTMAEYADADVILVADIHRGGVFAQIIGTLECLSQKYRDMIKGFIINRFRGDILLFKDGVDWIEKKTGKKVFGVLPWYSHFRIDPEDSVEIEQCMKIDDFKKDTPAIAVIRLPHIANFSDFNALSRIKDLQVGFIDKTGDFSKFKAIIIPGSKNTRADLEWLLNRFGQSLENYHHTGGKIFGICGGYQMLGHSVEDPHGLEGKPGISKGLCLLPVKTVLKAPKTTTISKYQWGTSMGEGYEIHMGYTTLTGGRPFLKINSRNSSPCGDQDGCFSEDGTVAGSYIHGIFDSKDILLKWLKWAGIKNVKSCDDMAALKERDYSLLSEHFKTYIDFNRFF